MSFTRLDFLDTVHNLERFLEVAKDMEDDTFDEGTYILLVSIMNSFLALGHVTGYLYHGDTCKTCELIDLKRKLESGDLDE